MLRLGLSEDRGFTLVLPDQTAIVYTENRDRHDKPLDYGVITQKKSGHRTSSSLQRVDVWHYSMELVDNSFNTHHFMRIFLKEND